MVLKGTEISWHRSSRCKDKIKTVHIMKDEEAVTKIDVVWPREFTLKKIKLFMLD